MVGVDELMKYNSFICQSERKLKSKDEALEAPQCVAIRYEQSPQKALRANARQGILSKSLVCFVNIEEY